MYIRILKDVYKDGCNHVDIFHYLSFYLHSLIPHIDSDSCEKLHPCLRHAGPVDFKVFSAPWTFILPHKIINTFL